MRGSSLSDPRVIRKLNESFVPVWINVTDEGIPGHLPALKPWVLAQRRRPWNRLAFNNSVVIDPTGTYRLGWSGCAHRIRINRSMLYVPDLYLDYLELCLARHRMLRVDPPDVDFAAFEGDPIAGWDWCSEDTRKRAERYLGPYRDGSRLATALADAGLPGSPPEGWDWCGNNVREFIKQLQAELGPERGLDLVVSEILESCADPDPDTRRFAIEGIGEIGPAAGRYAPRILPLLDDPDPSVRVAAADALRRIRAGSGGEGARR